MTNPDNILPLATLTIHAIYYRHAWLETLRKTWWWLREPIS